MTGARSRTFRPFAPRARRTILAIVLTLVLVSAASAVISIWSTGKSKDQASVVEVASRQRTLAERYVAQVLLVQRGSDADPARTGILLAESAHALLDGGRVPTVEGDDDEMVIASESDAGVRAQVRQQQRLIRDLVASGSAYLAGRPLSSVHLTAGERISTQDPVMRLRILSALTSNVSLDAARTIAAMTDHNIESSIVLEVGLGAAGILVSVLLAWALVATTRRQTAHFRSLVTSSTDLVLVLAQGGCRYVSGSVEKLTGRRQSELVGQGLFDVIHPDDLEALQHAGESGAAGQFVVRMRSFSGNWRSLEAHITDLRNDRHIRGVVVNARDVTERVTLEQELTKQALRDNFGAQLNEALEMADEEGAAHDVVRRAMVEISAELPMELLLSDSSRAHLEQAAVHPNAGAPACPVESPFSCVAVRRGNPVVFESSEALNACPKLQGRAGGPCSAVCVPISFMGRSLGVLHATSAVGDPPTADQVAQLTTLATQAGARIGTVRAFERTQLQAQTDGLTGLINRRKLETELRAFMRRDQPFALALADLDHFKQLNDTHGHEEGDRSLRIFSHVIKQVLRDEDLVARWGGEEFLLALPDADATDAIDVMNRIRDNLESKLRGGHVQFTASFGVTDSSHAPTLQELIQLADLGLYASKEGGRNCVTVGERPENAPASGNGRRRTPLLEQAAIDDDL